MTYPYIEDFVTAALDRQVEFFQNKENFEKLITIIAEIAQEYEDTIKDFYENRSLATAQGVVLDGLGEYLNVTRGTDTDATYRARLKTEIQALSRGGQVEAIISAARSLLDPVRVVVDQYFPATVIVIAEMLDTNIANPDVINAALQRVRAGGVEMALGVSLSGQSFKFASAPGQFGTGRGFSSTALGGDGGKFAELLR